MESGKIGKIIKIGKNRNFRIGIVDTIPLLFFIDFIDSFTWAIKKL